MAIALGVNELVMTKINREIMKLGNSNGNNKGKRYFVRGRDDQNLDLVYAEKAELFTAWFAKNMMAAKVQLLNKGTYDDDTFNDTYLRMYEIVLYTGREIRDYASYFHRAYFTNLIQGSMSENKYCELYANYDVEEDENSDFFEEVDLKNRMLSDDIMTYVYDRYDIQEFEIFKMYMNLKPAINYHALAKMTNKKYHVIQRLISKIVQDVKENTHFVVRRRHLVGA